MVFQYQYKVQGLHKAPAQVAGEVCASLENSADGLSPKTLLDASRAKDAPLHDEFEWDDSKAAECYREGQAGDLIRNLRIVSVEEEEETSARAFVNVQSASKPGSYHSLVTVLEDSEMKDKMFEIAKREMKSFIAKFQSLQQLSGVLVEMRKVI